MMEKLPPFVQIASDSLFPGATDSRQLEAKRSASSASGTRSTWLSDGRAGPLLIGKEPANGMWSIAPHCKNHHVAEV
jgi:hypothetical protein